jgi:high-affinity iron transporter
MVPVFVIFLREGVEASMIVSILLAFLDRIGQRRYFRDVIAGVVAALVLAGGGAFAAYFTIRTYSGSRVQLVFETATYALAATVLTYMTFWMASHARTISKELSERAEAAIGRGERVGLALIAFQAVGREGLETAVFTLAIVFATGTSGTLVGALAGLVAALALSIVIYRLGRRINLSVFFTVMGGLLMVFGAGLVADLVENLQQLGWITFLAHPLWNTSHVLSEDSALGDIFHSFFGYADRPTALQAVCYVAYVAVALTVFLRLSRKRPLAAPARTGARITAAPDPGRSVAGSLELPR